MPNIEEIIKRREKEIGLSAAKRSMTIEDILAERGYVSPANLLTGMPRKDIEYETKVDYEPLPEKSLPKYETYSPAMEKKPEVYSDTKKLYEPLPEIKAGSAIPKFDTYITGMEDKKAAYANPSVAPITKMESKDEAYKPIEQPKQAFSFKGYTHPDTKRASGTSKAHERASGSPVVADGSNIKDITNARQEAYETALEIAKYNGWLDSEGNYIGPKDKFKDIVFGQAQLTWQERQKNAEIGKRLFFGENVDFSSDEKYNKIIEENPQWLTKNPEYAKPYKVDDWKKPGLALTKTFRDATDIISLRLQQLPYGMEWAAKLGILGAMAGSATPGLGTAGGFVGGAGAGYTVGGGMYMAFMEGGSAYRDYIEQGMTPEIAKVAAIGTGLVNSYLEEVLGTRIGQIPGFNRMISNTMAKGIKDFAVEALGEVTEEGAQEAVSIMFGEIGKVVDSLINKKPIKNTLLDKESVDGIISGVIKAGAEESIQSGPGLVGSMLMGIPGGIATKAVTNKVTKGKGFSLDVAAPPDFAGKGIDYSGYYDYGAAVEGLRSMAMAKDMLSLSEFMDQAGVSVDINSVKGLDIPSDLAWGLKQIKLGAPIPYKLRGKYPMLNEILTHGLNIDDVVAAIENGTNVEEKPTDLKADTGEILDGSIESIGEGIKTQIGANIGVTEGTGDITSDTALEGGKKTDFETKIRQDILSNGIAYNNDYTKRVKITFENTGETTDSIGAHIPVGKYYLEVTENSIMQPDSGIRFDTIQEAQEAAIQEMLRVNNYTEHTKGQEKKAAYGKETTVVAGDGKDVGVKYAVVSAGDLVTSHDTTLAANKDYPAELQPRQRERHASVIQVESIMNNLRPELLGENPLASDGAPIIGGDFIVESGNGRAIALKKMYDTKHANGQKYIDWLKSNKEQFGIEGELPVNPVLVRMRTSDVDRAAFVKSANESSVAAMSYSEQARSDAQKLSDDTVLKFVQNDEGRINTAGNRDFIKSFVNDSVPKSEISKVVTGDGMLSQEGLQRLKNALFYKAYNDMSLIDLFSEEIDNNIKNITNVMLNIAPKLIYIKSRISSGTLFDIDFSNDIAAAAKRFKALKEKGESVTEYLKQFSMFGQEDAAVAEILNILEANNRSMKKLLTVFNYALDGVIKAGNPEQVSLIDIESPTKADILEIAIRRFNNEQSGEAEGQSTIFDIEPQDGIVAGEKDKGRRTEGTEGEGSRKEVDSKGDESIGYHAGDLGKAEHFGKHFGSARDTGHFGTGTYFVGDKTHLDVSSYKNRPVHEVDFDKYRLFKPLDAMTAERLHEVLKYINRYHSTATENAVSDYTIDKIRYEETGVILQTLKEIGKFNEEEFQSVANMTSKEYVDNNVEKRAVYDYLQKQLDSIQRDNASIKNAKLKKAYFDQWADYTLGLENGKANEILDKVYGDYLEQTKGKGNYRIWDELNKTDSLSTRFMKALGYDGVDVRHIPSMDNTTYGSVIYDLKDEAKASTKTDVKATDIVTTSKSKRYKGAEGTSFQVEYADDKLVLRSFSGNKIVNKETYDKDFINGFLGKSTEYDRHQFIVDKDVNKLKTEQMDTTSYVIDANRDAIYNAITEALKEANLYKKTTREIHDDHMSKRKEVSKGSPDMELLGMVRQKVIDDKAVNEAVVDAKDNALDIIKNRIREAVNEVIEENSGKKTLGEIERVRAYFLGDLDAIANRYLNSIKKNISEVQETDKPKGPVKNNLDWLNKQADLARDRLKKRHGESTTLYAGLPMDDLVDYAIIGASKIANGTVEFAAWSKEMLEEFGSNLRLFLRAVYGQSEAMLEMSPEELNEMMSLADKEDKAGHIDEADVDVDVADDTQDIDIDETGKAETNLKATLSRNYDKDGIEIGFDEKPDNDTTHKLRMNGFKYSSRNKLWYVKYTDSKYEFAQNFVNEYNGLKQVETAINPNTKIADFVQDKLKNGEKFTYMDLTKAADEAFGGTQAQGVYSSKDATDAMELGINLYLLNQKGIDVTTDDPMLVSKTLKTLQNVLELIPTQTKRTDEMMQYQQFSTPPTIAYLASWVANIDKTDVMLEPSAGIGGLALFAKKAGAKVYVNEYSERRFDVIKNMPFDGFYKENAEHLDNILPDSIKPTVIVMNPPFSATAGRMGDKNSTKYAKAHIEQALKRLEPGGRLVAIVGQGMAHDTATFKDWWADIESEYNVRANVGLDGKNYTKYGTSFDIQMFVIDKTGPTTQEVITGKVNTLEELKSMMEAVRDDRTRIESQGDQSGNKKGDEGTRNTGGTRHVDNPSGDGMGNTQDGKSGQGVKRGSGGSSGTSDVGGSGKGLGDTDGTNIGGRNTDRNKKGDGQRRDDLGSRKPVGDELNRNDIIDIKPTIRTDVDSRKVEDTDDSVYSHYVPRKLKIDGAFEQHVTPLVESAAMSSVDPPDPAYSPILRKEVVEKGILSLPQLETVVYAGQAHANILPNGTRRGYYIGDGTGVGKGRQIAGIIQDNFNKNRPKAVWLSKNFDLISDAQRDWIALGGNKDDVFSHQKFKKGKGIEADQGILFSAYTTLWRDGRLDQITDWLGKDFDGVIVFDEAHNMNNSKPVKKKMGKSKPAKMALAGIDLQKALPKARIVYASATSATDVTQFAYAERLGLWGEGTAFTDVDEFIGCIQEGGIAAMELMARDLKAMGLYLARNLSFEGVEYETLTHDLNPMQVEIYDKAAEAWQIVLQNIGDALAVTKQDKNSNARRNATGQFWCTNQRFFNQIMTSMSVPSLIQDIKTKLANGESAVIQLVNTNEAAQERAFASMEDKGIDLEDLDMSPTEMLVQYLNKSFPIQQYEEYADDEGVIRSKPVVDSMGNPVINKEALAMRDALIADVRMMKIPDGAIDMIIDEFGSDMVAEITGRKRRLVYKVNEKTGRRERVVEPWGDAKASQDVNNFQNGDKRILIFSGKGDTGKSYHADMDAKNQTKRNHYLLQPGWNATKATQGLGRTHRSNQAQSPSMILVTTDLKGQKRFVSTIARRLNQMGAITKGQREAGSGIFSEKDNLEGPLASDVLVQFYKNLVRNEFDGIDGMDTINKMGLKQYFVDNNGFLIDPDYSIASNIPKFLNRVINLQTADQNAVFNAFINMYEIEVNKAIENGTLDTGLENYKALAVKTIDEHVIKEDKGTKAQTKYVQLLATQPTIILELNSAKNRDNFMTLVRNKETGEVRALIKSVTKTSAATGAVTQTYRLLSPQYGKENVYVKKTVDDKFVKLPEGEWNTAWKEAIEKVPKTYDVTLHMLTGTLLPIWDKLPKDRARVVRVVDGEGNSYLGRLIAPDQIDTVLRRFSISRTREKADGRKIFSRVFGDNMRATFEKRMSIVRRRVAGENRLELKGPEAWFMANSLRHLGMFTETINYERRFFIPTDEAKAATVIDRILKSYEFVDFENARYSDDEDDVQSMIGRDSSNYFPQGDGSAKLKDVKTVDAIVGIIEDKIGVPIMTGRFRQRAHGIFKVVPEVIRVKITNDLPTICHEVGHFLDKKFELDNKKYKSELVKLGKPTSKTSYSEKQVRKEGVAEFVRLYLTDPEDAIDKAPTFFAHFESKVDSDGLAALNEIRTEIFKVKNLSDTDRIKNDISVGESRTSTKNDNSLSGRLSSVIRAWYDEFYGFTKAQKYAEKKGWRGKNVDTLVKLYRGIDEKVMANLTFAQTDLEGNVIGKSYKDIISGIAKKELDDFRAYLVAMRSLDYRDRGMAMPQAFSTYYNALNEYDSKYPHFKDVYKELQTWADNELQLLIDSGMLSSADAANIKMLNQNYAPLKRIMEAVEAVYGGGGNTLGEKNPIKRAKGSGKTIIDPLESIIVNAFTMRKAAEVNQIRGVLFDMSQDVDGFGQEFVERVAPGIKGFSFNVKEIGRELEAIIEGDIRAQIEALKKSKPSSPQIAVLENYLSQFDISSLDLDKIVTLFRANYAERNGEITYYRDGKPVLLRVNSELYQAFKGFNTRQAGFVLNMLSSATRVLKAGALFTARYIVRNALRDPGGALIQSESNINPVDLVKGYISAVKRDEWLQGWRLHGGDTGHMLTGKRANVQDVLYDDVIGYNMMDKLKDAIDKPSKEKLTRLLLHVMGPVEDVMGLLEAGPKVAEYRKLMEKHGFSEKDAARISREVNQDFKKYGYTSKEINRYVAFFAPNLGGNIRAIEAYAKNPARTLLKGLLYVTLPTMLLYYLTDENEKYKQLVAWRKAMFYNIPLGNPKTADKFLMIPKPHVHAFVFSSLPELMLDKLRHDDYRAWEKLRESFALSFDVPLMPTAIAPEVQVWGNRSWSNVPIESEGERRDRVPWLIKNERTSTASSKTAELFKDVPMLKKLSPKQIDYLIKGHTGSVGDFFWRLPDTVKAIKDDPEDFSKYPVIPGFVLDSAYASENTNVFYDYGEELTTRLKEAKETGTYRAISHLPKKIQDALVPAVKSATKEYNSVAQSLSKARKSVDQINSSKEYSAAEKRVRAREVRLQMNKLAKNFNDKYERFKKDNNIK